MPVSVDDLDDGPEELFEFGVDTQPHRVVSFLSRNSEQAFTQTEIAEATGIKRSSVGVVLLRLADRDLVEHKGKYWTVAKDDRIAAYAAQSAASSESTQDDYYGE